VRTGCVALAVTVSVALALPTAFDDTGCAAGDLLLAALTDNALGLTLALIGLVAAALVAVVGMVELPLVAVVGMVELPLVAVVGMVELPLVAVVGMVELPCSSGGSVVVVTTAPTWTCPCVWLYHWSPATRSRTDPTTTRMAQVMGDLRLVRTAWQNRRPTLPNPHRQPAGQNQ